MNVKSAVLVGIQAKVIELECTSGAESGALQITGLPESQSRESRVRVQNALTQYTSREKDSLRSLTVTLNPPVKGSVGSLDLAIALTLLQGLPGIENYLVCGELSLNGGVNPIRGVASMALKAKELGLGIVVPAANATEASYVVPGLEVIGVQDLGELVEFAQSLRFRQFAPVSNVPESPRHTFDDVDGLERAKMALRVAVQEGFNVLFVGKPGCGATMLSRRITSLMSEMTFGEVVETTQAFSAAGLNSHGVVTQRPFRAPHYTVSDTSLVGGVQGSRGIIGEAALAHNGVLMLDELPNFSKQTIQRLKSVIKAGSVQLGETTAPAKFMLVGAMDPCPCFRDCKCSSEAWESYRNRVDMSMFDIAIDLDKGTAEYITDSQCDA